MILPAFSILFFFTFLLLYVLHYRRRSLAAKYAAWQAEGQEIAVATHEALHASSEKRSVPYPYISIVVPTYNQETQLRYLLPRLLGQRYKGKFEVIVVDQLSEDDTPQYLDSLHQQEPRRFRYRLLPTSTRQIEHRKLAVTIGIKAALGEWVIIVNPDTTPQTKDWLQCYAENLDEDLDWVEAYYNYEDDGSCMARRAILERVYAFTQRLSAYERGHLIGCETAGYAVRRKWFLAEGGFADSLALPFGEETLFAARHADTGRTLMLCSPDTKLLQELPDRLELRLKRACRVEISRHLPFSLRWGMGWRRGCTNALLGALVCEGVGYWVFRLWHFPFETAQPLFYFLRTYEAEQAFPDLLWLITVVLTLVFSLHPLRRSLHALQERPYGAYVWLYDLLCPFRDFFVSLRSRFMRYGRERHNL